MNTQRFNLSNFFKIKNESDIPGNFTSVRGEYLIPDINMTGFYKENGCMLDAENDADLRELLASKILEKIEVPHADIVLTQDGSTNGCLSMNILKANEEFIDPDSYYSFPTNAKPIETLQDFIDSDISKIINIPGVSKEFVDFRVDFLKNYLLVSALISNTDIKLDNMFPIYNSETGEFRSPEIYDLGISFIHNDTRFFFDHKSPTDIIEELYASYPDAIFPLAQKIENNLSLDTIDEILSDNAYNGFDVHDLASIKNSLLDRVSQITRYNHNILEYGAFDPVITPDQIAEKTKGTNISLIYKVSNYIFTLKNKILGKDEKDGK